ncbi:MAG: adenylate/guanylate cyclase domain-containing protein [Hyphomicrobiaceae bacterium]|nr:adenylate/guanylate cyclase domain-containing protein [Hyphomicrobiaceae bacterium]
MHVLLRGDLTQRLRLASGLVLFAFVLTHFVNHALGLIGVDAMLAMQQWRTAITRSVPGSLILAAAILVHAGLALYRIARRSTLAMPAWEAVQIASGLAIPYLLVQHVVFNRGANLAAGTVDDYRYELASLWPAFAWTQAVLLVIVWVHAMVGLHYWLRLDARYRAIQPLFVAAAVALPILALAGFLSAGREMAARLGEPGAREALMAAAQPPDAATAAWLTSLKHTLQAGFYALAAAAIALPVSAMTWRATTTRLGIAYVGGPTVRSACGPTLLEISRANGVPHASVCGGRARCSTCRVHVGRGRASLPPPRAAEAETLASVGAPAGVRLACQIRPPVDLVVHRLVAPGLSPGRPFAPGASEQGTERDLVVLFFDLRGFTALSENRLPYDVVFLLNGLFTAVSAEIVRHGGRIDKYMGDGLMAVFGIDRDIEVAAADALAAVVAIDHALEGFSLSYRGEIGQTLRCAMGLHLGTLVVGRIGSPERAETTVIGAAVNAASRLESLAKERNAQLAVSGEVLAAGRVSKADLAIESVAVRGFSEAISVAIVRQARDLAAKIGADDATTHA